MEERFFSHPLSILLNIMLIQEDLWANIRRKVYLSLFRVQENSVNRVNARGWFGLKPPAV